MLGILPPLHMPHLNSQHTTEYSYHNPVGELRHRLMTRPHDSHELMPHAAKLAAEPASVSVRWANDVFVNSFCVLIGQERHEPRCCA